MIAIYDPSKVKLVSSRWFNRGNTGQQTVIDICKDIMVRYVLMVEDFKILVLVLIFQLVMLLKMVRLPGIVKVSLN